MNKYIFQWNILLLPYGMQLGAHAGNEPPLVSSLNIILSLSFWYSEMPCSNLFPGCFQGYYRSFWLSNRQEMWSSSSGAVCCSEPALRDLCVTARTSVTAPILLKITFVWLFFLFQLLWTFLSAQKHSPPFHISACVVWKLCNRPAECYFPYKPYLHPKYFEPHFNELKGFLQPKGLQKI